MSDETAVTYALADGVATITLCRPGSLNAVNRAVRLGLIEAFGRFEADAEAKVAILTGEGRAFCAGADLKEMVDTGNRAPGDQGVPDLEPEVDPSSQVCASPRKSVGLTWISL